MMGRLSYYIVLGVVAFAVFLFLIYYFFCDFRCWIEFKLPGGASIVLGFLSGLLAYLYRNIIRQIRFVAIIVSIAAGLTLAMLGGILSHIILPEMTQECCTPCFVSEKKAINTLRKLIEKDAQAVIAERATLLELIFSPDALIVDYYNDVQEQPFREHYSIKFERFDFNYIVHGAVTLVQMNLSDAFFLTKEAFMLPDRGIMETSSSGSFRVSATGVEERFSNPEGSDRWMFVRENRCCCWKISKVEFGIHLNSN